jgi:heptosyltransferase-3
MRGLTRNVGTTHTKIKPGDNADFKRVLIIRPNNRLGNLLMITPLLQEVTEFFPQCTIDLFVRGNLAPILFKNYPGIGRIIKLPGKPFKHLIDYVAAWISIKRKRYDLVINVVPNSSSGRLSTKFANARYNIFGDVNEQVKEDCNNYEHVARYPVCNLRKFMAMFGINRLSESVPDLNLKLAPDELIEGKKLVQELVPGDRPVISIFTYATGTKCYSCDWWLGFYERLKAEFPQFEIVEVLPAENVSQINFTAPSFYSRDIRQLGAFIANTVVFIGADSGIMHLASAVGTPTVGLFSVTNPKAFRPYNNGSIAIDTREGNVDEWIAAIRGVVKSV